MEASASSRGRCRMDAVKQPRRCPALSQASAIAPYPQNTNKAPKAGRLSRAFFGPRGTNLSMAARMIRCKPESRISKSNPIRPHRNAQKLHSQRLAVQYAVTIEIDDRWLRSPQMRSKKILPYGEVARLVFWLVPSATPSRSRKISGSENVAALRRTHSSGNCCRFTRHSHSIAPDADVLCEPLQCKVKK